MAIKITKKKPINKSTIISDPKYAGTMPINPVNNNPYNFPPLSPEMIEQNKPKDTETKKIVPYSDPTRTYQGGTMNADEYEAYKAGLGFDSRGGKVTENVRQALAQEKGTPEYRQAQAEQQAALASQIGQTQGFNYDNIEANPTDVGEIVGAAGAKVLPAAASGVGAAVGTALLTGGGLAAATGGASLVVGAAVAIGMVAAAAIGSIKKQRTENTATQTKVLLDSKKDLGNMIKLMKADPANAAAYIDAYNIKLTKIQKAYAQMQADANADLFKFETNRDKLQAFENFYSVGGSRDYFNMQMQIAIMGGTIDAAGIDLQAMMSEYTE